MCGICGVVTLDANRPVDPAAIRRMTDRIVHRGPDSSGYHTAPGIGLGVRRLSIIDLETGDQPIANEDGSIVLVCNGEIYNYVELRRDLVAAGHQFRTKSDAEVVVHLYETYGVDCLQHLRGMFALAVWDARRRRLFLARDRFGIKPLHYATANDELYFGSEAKSILAAAGIDRNLDVEAMTELFEVGYVVGSKTLFASIRQVPPGHYLLWENGRASAHQYWDVRFPPQAEFESRSAEDWADELREKLRETIRLHMRSDVPMGAWLSGGLDSSGIVSLMREFVEPSVQTFSLRFEDRRCDEVGRCSTLDRFPGYDLTNTQVVCRLEDFNVLPKLVWHGENPPTSGHGIPQLLLAERTAESVKVIATGEGADEIFGGYTWFRGDKLARLLARLPRCVRKMILLGPLLRRFRPGLGRLYDAAADTSPARRRNRWAPRGERGFHHLLSADLGDRARRLPEEKDVALPPEGFELWHPFNQLQYYEMKMRLPSFILPLLDRTTMAHSVEARVPFLDHKLAEFCAQIPPSLKMKRFREKYILRRALRNDLPREIAWRRKFGMIAPHDQWLLGKLPPFAEEALSERTLRAKGYFDPAAVHELLGRRSVASRREKTWLMTVLILQLWDDRFVRGADVTPYASV